MAKRCKGKDKPKNKRKKGQQKRSGKIAKKAKTTQTATKKSTAGCRKKTNGTKRAANSFMLFLAEVRVRLLAQNPTMKVTEIAKKAGSCWRQLSEEAKDKYRKKACGKSSGECLRCPHCKQLLPKK